MIKISYIILAPKRVYIARLCVQCCRLDCLWYEEDRYIIFRPFPLIVPKNLDVAKILDVLRRPQRPNFLSVRNQAGLPYKFWAPHPDNILINIKVAYDFNIYNNITTLLEEWMGPSNAHSRENAINKFCLSLWFKVTNICNN